MPSNALSLKSYIPKLSALLGMKEAALYERQRALVRLDLMFPEDGRGPGSGVRLDGRSAALLLIAAVVVRLSNAGMITGALAKAELQTSKRPVLAARSFEDALTAILEDIEKAAMVQRVSLCLDPVSAQIHQKFSPKGNATTLIRFGKDRPRPPITYLAELDGSILIEIANDVNSSRL